MQMGDTHVRQECPCKPHSSASAPIYHSARVNSQHQRVAEASTLHTTVMANDNVICQSDSIQLASIIRKLDLNMIPTACFNKGALELASIQSYIKPV